MWHRDLGLIQIRASARDLYLNRMFTVMQRVVGVENKRIRNQMFEVPRYKFRNSCYDII